MASRSFWLVGLALLILSSAQAHLQPGICSLDASPRIVDVYPSSDRLPKNTLRFYIYFSAPMDETTVFSAISLNDANGRQIEGGFLNTTYGLWSPEGTRLTLLMDPGRVKSGLHASNMLGPALKKDERYTLSVETTARDRQGCPLVEAHSKTFEVSGRDNSVPNPSLWSISAPSAKSADRLKIETNEMIDHLSLAYRIRVLSSSGTPIPGRIEIGVEERSWFFTPNTRWDEDEYAIKVDPILEDVAGNRVSGLFDAPPEARNGKQPKPSYIQFYSVADPD
ncbi:MAG: hypothetical protein AAGF33_15225 [Pseudomonadota bacterium]